MVSKFAFYGIFLQVFFLSFLFADKSIAQQFKSVYDVKISIDLVNVSVEDVFREIESKTNYNFLFNRNILDQDLRMTLKRRNSSVADILMEVSKMSKLKFKQINFTINVNQRSEHELGQQDLEVIVQTRNVTGRVISQEDGQGLPGVNVIEMGTINGTVTDVQGNYSLNVMEGARLVFSSVGYTTEEVAIGNRTVVDLVMRTDVKQLSELVVIGYGTRTKSDVTSAISSIDSEGLGKAVSSNANLAIQGRAAGVYVGNNSGNPAHAPRVRIRGVNTWGDSDPLYVIDGVPIVDPRQSGYYAPLNIMNIIDPANIESISILKDASAAAIYGVRASNGVILITTKRGRRGEDLRAEFSSRVGVQNIVQRLDLMNSEQFIEHVQYLWSTDPTLSRNSNDVRAFDPNSPHYLGGSPTTDWQDGVKNKNAPSQEYSFQVSGGSQKTDYFMSFGSSAMEGTLIASDFSRLSGNMKINTDLNNWLKMGVDYRLVRTDHRNPQSGENLWRYSELIHALPVQPIYGDGPNGYAPVVVGFLPNGTYSSQRIYGDGTRRNFNGISSLGKDQSILHRNIGIVYAEIEPIKSFKVRLQSSMDVTNGRNAWFHDSRASVFNRDAGDPRASGGGNSLGSYEMGTNTRSSNINEITANYSTSIGDHRLDFLASGMSQKDNFEGFFGTTSFVTTNDISLIRLGGENQYTRTGSSIGRDAMAGFLGRISYNYRNTYYLDLTTRRDGTARFSPEYRWGTFPSVSGAWRISNETFFDNINFLGDVKLRAGWGQLGNQNTRSWAYLLPINQFPSYAWGNDPARPGLGYYSTGAAVYSIANPSLEWERTTTFNFGVDAVVSNNLDFSIEYYNKLTGGILQGVTLPKSSGVRDQPVDNIATVRNSGIELSLNYSGDIGKLSYNLGTNFSTIKNRVVETYNNIPFDSPMGYIEVGKPMFYIRGYKMGGIFQTQAEVDEWKSKYTDASYQTAKVAPGDIYYLDLRSAPDQPGTFYKDEPDNRIDSYDQVFIGKSIPGFHYGFNVNLTYNRISLTTQLTGVGDVDKFNSVRRAFETPGTGNNLSTKVLESWTPENPSTTRPRRIWGDPAGNWRRSDRFVESGAYLRMSYVQLSYNLPPNLIRNVLNNLNIYAGASNLFSLTNYTGFDPENDDYPTPRAFFAGLNVRF
jgi:TonB-dependent starch-binding outer membrane protein SusC